MSELKHLPTKPVTVSSPLKNSFIRNQHYNPNKEISVLSNASHNTNKLSSNDNHILNNVISVDNLKKTLDENGLKISQLTSSSDSLENLTKKDFKFDIEFNPESHNITQNTKELITKYNTNPSYGSMDVSLIHDHQSNETNIIFDFNKMYSEENEINTESPKINDNITNNYLSPLIENIKGVKNNNINIIFKANAGDTNMFSSLLTLPIEKIYNHQLHDPIGDKISIRTDGGDKYGYDSIIDDNPGHTIDDDLWLETIQNDTNQINNHLKKGNFKDAQHILNYGIDDFNIDIFSEHYSDNPSFAKIENNEYPPIRDVLNLEKSNSITFASYLENNHINNLDPNETNLTKIKLGQIIHKDNINILDEMPKDYKDFSNNLVKIMASKDKWKMYKTDKEQLSNINNIITQILPHIDKHKIDNNTLSSFLTQSLENNHDLIPALAKNNLLKETNTHKALKNDELSILKEHYLNTNEQAIQNKFIDSLKDIKEFTPYYDKDSRIGNYTDSFIGKENQKELFNEILSNNNHINSLFENDSSSIATHLNEWIYRNNGFVGSVMKRHSSDIINGVNTESTNKYVPEAIQKAIKNIYNYTQNNLIPNEDLIKNEYDNFKTLYRGMDIKNGAIIKPGTISTTPSLNLAAEFTKKIVTKNDVYLGAANRFLDNKNERNASSNFSFDSSYKNSFDNITYFENDKSRPHSSYELKENGKVFKFDNLKNTKNVFMLLGKNSISKLKNDFHIDKELHSNYDRESEAVLII